MKYKKIVEATFLSRPNRFEAYVCIDGKEELVHVKNTGRCKEILLPATKVILSEADNPKRKTKYDLVAAYKKDFGLINIDSQAPNKVAGEWLSQFSYDKVIPEYTFGESRIDFFMEKGEDRYLMEVKGCTQEKDGIGYFPDAPTERGVKHLKELMKAVDLGYHAMLAFVIQMNGVTEVLPNSEIHPEFKQTLDEAKAHGVQVIFIPCRVEKEGFVYK